MVAAMRPARAATVLCVLLTLHLVPCARAQDDLALPRGRAFGIANRADGTPWAGAVVHAREAGLRYEAPLGGVIDAASATADERGRFGLELLEGRAYALWVENADPADATRRHFSTAVVRARAGERVELVGEESPRGPTQIRLRGLTPTRQEPLRATLREHAVERTTEWLLVEPSLTLPARPVGEATLTIIDATGRPRLRVELPEDPADCEVQASAPRLFRARVEELSNKAPIAGAEIAVVLDGTWFPLGTTDADGLAVLDTAFAFAALDETGSGVSDALSQFVVRATGYHLGMLMLPDCPLRDEEGLGEEIHARCHPPVDENGPSKATLLVDGLPARGWSVQAHATCWECDAEDSMMGTEVELLLTTDKDGTIDLTGLRDGDESVALRLDRDALAALPPAWRGGLPASVAVFGADLGSGGSFTLDLVRDFQPVTIRIHNAQDRGPAAGIAVYVVGDDHHGAAELTTDRAGNLRTLLPRNTDSPMVVGTIGPAGWRVVALTEPPAARDGAEPLELDLELHATLRVRMVPRYPEGFEPTAELAIHAWPQNGGHSIEATAPDGALEGAPYRDVDPETACQFSHHLMLQSVLEGGASVLHLPSVPGSYELSASLWQDDTFLTGETTFAVDGTEKEIQLAIAMARQ